jgi:DNA-binding CsgD family transcriptional regulator
MLQPRLVDLWGRIATGRLNKEIAYDMKLTEGTVKEYVHRLTKEVGARNRGELIRLWWLGQLGPQVKELTERLKGLTEVLERMGDGTKVP